MHGVTTVAFAPDGATLATGTGGPNGHAGAVRLWDVATGKEIRPFAAHPGGVTTIAVSRDGKLVATCSSSDKAVRLWDVASGRELRRLEGHETGVDEVQFSPDGKLLASTAWDQPVFIWDVATGKVVQALRDHATLGPHMRFSADGKMLATAGNNATAGVWDVAAGKLVQEFAQPPNSVAAMLSFADGRVLAFERADSENEDDVVIALWDLVAGRVVRRFSGHKGMANGVALSPDGRLLASRGEDKTIRVWEVSTGAERARFEDPSENSGWTGTQFLAFSPDGRSLATVGTHDADVRLWDLATGQPLPPLSGHRGWMGAVEFSVDGRLLVTGSQDTTTIAWDLSTPARQPARPVKGLTEEGFRRLWNDLRDRDAGKAHRALWDLVAAGGPAVAALRGRLRAAEGVDAKQVAEWIAQLDHPQYLIRERATTALMQAADQAESALRAVLVRTASAEVRQRVRRILDGAIDANLAPDRLRELRAVEALERLADPAARQVLDDLSRGADGALLTREAQEAAKRLNARLGPRQTE
jgi:WD40 repeat protein